MVTFKNQGRCANFLYQLCAVIGYARKHGLEFTVPTTTKDEFWNPLFMQHLANPEYNKALPIVMVEEKMHCYQELPYHPKWDGSNIVLLGYFQSVRYFDHCIDNVREMLGFKNLTKIDAISLHVRRGDYVGLPNHHPVCPLRYYESALSDILSASRIKTVMVFSDDIEWCKANFHNSEYAHFVFSEGRTAIDDIRIMASCTHNIVANSSFSTFAAIMNDTPGKIVIAPHRSKYFGTANRKNDVRDVYPEGWVEIDY